MTISLWHLLDLLKPFKIKYLFVSLYLIVGFSAIFIRLFDIKFSMEIAAWLTRVGYVWMGLLTYIFVWSSFCLILKLFHIGPTLAKDRIIFFVVEVGLCFLIFITGYITATNVKIVKHELVSNKVDNLKIVQISDNHIGYMNSKKQFDKIVRKIAKINPDLLLITGDFIENENNYAQKKDIGKSLRSLSIKYGIWAVKGNHEYIAGPDNSLHYMNSLGIKVLRDEIVELGESILLIGQEDIAVHRYGGVRLSLDELLEPVKEKLHDKYIIVMSHQIPDHSFYENKNLDLVLSGHTHNGQIFPYNFVVKKIYDIGYGLVRRGESVFYVSSGTGIWGPPMRLCTKSEIVVFEIKNNNNK